MEISREMPPFESLLPHGSEIVLLERLCDWGDEFVECAAGAGSAPFLRRYGSRIPAWVGLEYMAQTAAVLAGIKAWKAGETPRAGVVIASRSIVCKFPSFERGEPLTVRAETDGDGGRAIRFRCQIRKAGGETAQTGTITVCLLDDSILSV